MLIIHVCLCVQASVCARENVYIKVINIKKYKRDDVTCNIKMETEIHVHSDVKPAVKW